MNLPRFVLGATLVASSFASADSKQFAYHHCELSYDRPQVTRELAKLGLDEESLPTAFAGTSFPRLQGWEPFDPAKASPSQGNATDHLLSLSITVVANGSQRKVTLELEQIQRAPRDGAVIARTQLSTQQKSGSAGEAAALLAKAAATLPACVVDDYYARQDALWKDLQNNFTLATVRQALNAGLYPGNRFYENGGSKYVYGLLDYVTIYGGADRLVEIQELIDRGADPRWSPQPGYKGTFDPAWFDCSIGKGMRECLALYAKQGIDLNYRPSTGYPFLHENVIDLSLDDIAFVVSLGASLEVEDRWGRTVIEVLNVHAGEERLRPFVEALKPRLDHSDAEGWSMLDHVIRRARDNDGAAAWWIAHGATIGKRDLDRGLDDCNALCGAISLKDFELVTSLLDQGVRLNFESRKSVGGLAGWLSGWEPEFPAKVVRELHRRGLLRGDVVIGPAGSAPVIGLARAAVILRDQALLTAAISEGSFLGQVAGDYKWDSALLTAAQRDWAPGIAAILQTDPRFEKNFQYEATANLLVKESRAVALHEFASSGAPVPPCAVITALANAPETMAEDLIVSRGFDVNQPCDPYNPNISTSVVRNRFHALELLIARGVNIAAQKNSVMTAAANEDPRYLRALLTAGANPNQYEEYNDTPLAAAAGAGVLANVDQLVRAGARVNPIEKYESCALRDAAEKNHNEVAFYLLSHGANPDCPISRGADPIRLAIQNGNSALFERLVSADAHPDVSDDRLMVGAVKSRSLAMVRYLLGKGSKAFETKGTLHLAAKNMDHEILKELVATHPDLNAQFDFYKQGDFYGSEFPTPVFIAAAKDDLEGFELLVAAGARWDGVYRKTALAAAESGGARVGARLVELGQRLDEPVGLGISQCDAMTMAARADNVAFVTLWLDNGYPIDHPGCDNRAVNAAIYAESPGVAMLLVKRGADLEQSSYAWNGSTNVGGFFPLHLAMRNKLKDIVITLAPKVHHVNTLTGAGESPLAVLIWSVRSEDKIEDLRVMIDAFVHAGGDVNLHGASGKSPLAVARYIRASKELIDYLVSIGARE